MRSWVDAWPAVLAAAAVLLVPGLVGGLAGGLRGIPLLGLGPALSVSVVAVTAVVAGALHAPFGTPAVVVGTVLAAVAALLGRLALRALRGLAPPVRGPRPDRVGGRLRARESTRDGSRDVLVAVAGTIAGGACAALAVVRGIPRVDAVPQTFDAVFHLGAVWHVLHTGDASSLTLGSVTSPERTRAFYPGAWHAVSALVVDLSGASIPVAANAVALVMAAGVWPLGVLLLSRFALGARPGMLAAAGLLSAGFGVSPYLLLSYGTLWPNALGTVLLPAGVACAAAVFDLGVDPPMGKGAGLVAGLVLSPGLALSHPNAAVSAMVLGTVIGLAALWRWARLGLPPSGRRLLVAGAVTSTVLVAEGWFIGRSPVFATTRTQSWPARETVSQAVGEWVLAAPMHAPIPLLLAGAVILGGLVALRRPELHWLVACHVVSGAVFAVVAGSDGPLARALSGPWWDDPFRLAALLGVTGVPLAVVGLAEVGRWVTSTRLGLSRSVLRGAVVPVLAGIVAVCTGGMYAADNAAVLGVGFRGQAMLGGEERALLERLPDTVGADAVIAGSPWNGSALAQPLGDRQVLFPHLLGDWGSDRELVGARLNLAGYDPAVCSAVRRLGVDFVLDGPVRFWPGDGRQAAFAGLAVADRAGFTPVDHGGRLTLYRITVCQ